MSLPNPIKRTRELRWFARQLLDMTEDYEEAYRRGWLVHGLLNNHLDNAAGDSSWVKEALEILEGKKP